MFRCWRTPDAGPQVIYLTCGWSVLFLLENQINSTIDCCFVKSGEAPLAPFDLQDLYAFLALSEHGSFRYAAEAICISQSALSRRIEKLETALGVRLFERTTRRVTLTQTGRAFAPKAQHLLSEFEDAGRY